MGQNEKIAELTVKLGEKEINRQVEIVQNFYSTRAVAHASFFVASIFGLFTVLALMDSSFLELSSNWSSWAALVLLSFTYWGVFAVGWHSFMKFSQYSIYAEYAESLTAQKANELVVTRSFERNEIVTLATILARPREWFNRKLKRYYISFSRHNKDIYDLAYVGIGISAFIAFYSSS